MSFAYLDDQLIEKKSLSIKVADFGFARGVAIFDLARVYNGIPFRLEDHLDRFESGARQFGIVSPLSRQQITAKVKELIVKNAYPHSAIKLYLTAGECGSMGPSFATDDNFTPHLIIMEDEVKSMHPDAPKGMELYQRGVSLKVIPFSRQLSEYKTTNYAPGFLATRQAAAEGWDDILFTHADGFVTEATTSNLFAVIDGTLCTPAIGMLLGITRKVILELAPKIGLPIRECNLSLNDIRKATEAFITGSIVEMMPVKKIDDIVFPATVQAPVYKKLRQVFSAYIKTYKAP